MSKAAPRIRATCRTQTDPHGLVAEPQPALSQTRATHSPERAPLVRTAVARVVARSGRAAVEAGDTAVDPGGFALALAKADAQRDRAAAPLLARATIRAANAPDSGTWLLRTPVSHGDMSSPSLHRIAAVKMCLGVACGTGQRAPCAAFVGLHGTTSATTTSVAHTAGTLHCATTPSGTSSFASPDEHASTLPWKGWDCSRNRGCSSTFGARLMSSSSRSPP